MILTFINGAVYNSTSSNSAVCNKPTDTADGDIMFALVRSASTVGYATSPPTGWKRLGRGAPTGYYDLYYKVASGEGANYTWGFGATGRLRVTIVTYRGTSGYRLEANVYSDNGYSTSNTTVRAGSVTTGLTNTPILFFGSMYDLDGPTFTKPANIGTDSWTEDWDATGTSGFAETVCSILKSGTGATGNIDSVSTDATTNKQAFAVIVNSSNVLYVGGKTGSAAGSLTTGITIDLTALTGGLATSASAGDIVVALVSTGSTADRSIGVATAGYSELKELYSGDTYDTNLSLSYKIMGSTPDTSIVSSASGASADAIGMTVQVWRNINQTTPIDTDTQEATGENGGLPTPPAITPTTSGAIIICCGASALDTSAVFTNTSLNNFISVASADTYDSMTGMGSIIWNGGAYTPVEFTDGASSTSASWAAATLALRPLVASGPANLKTYNTNVKANIKTINTNAIANVKTLNTNA